MNVTVGDIRKLIEFLDDNIRVIRHDSEYGYENAEMAGLEFVKGKYAIELADPEASVATEIALVIW